MEILVVLYFIDLTFGAVGQGKVTRSDLATWFRVSKTKVAEDMEKMIETGLVKKHEISSLKSTGFIVKYSMTVLGKNYLDYNYDSAYQLYRIQVAKVIAAIEAVKPSPEYRKLGAKEKRQLDAGQKGMFDV